MLTPWNGPDIMEFGEGRAGAGLRERGLLLVFQEKAIKDVLEKGNSLTAVGNIFFFLFFNKRTALLCRNCCACLICRQTHGLGINVSGTGS